MDVIVTHQNADFDALAGLVAAKKLYPQARVVLPSMLERSVRDFTDMLKGLVIFDEESEAPFEQMRRLIVVDTRSRRRIGRAADYLRRKGVSVHCYDHHPRRRSDITADKDVFRPYGATVTILVELLKQQHITISPLEATVFALGIYEDTGSLTYQTTTRMDIDMVGYLFSRGANLAIISSCLNRELDEHEVRQLAALLTAVRRYAFENIHIAVVTVLETDTKLDLSLMAMKIQEVENTPVLFIIAQSGRRVHVVGRSRLPAVNVSKILRQFGGHGHASAAAVSIPDAVAQDISEKLLAAAQRAFPQRITAKNIMSQPVKAVPPEALVRDVLHTLEKLEIGAIPVVSGTELTGLITLNDLKRAQRNGYGHAPVKGYVRTAGPRATPNTPLPELQTLLRKNHVTHIPVVHRKKLLGIISRSDLIKATHGDMLTPLLVPPPTPPSVSTIPEAGEVRRLIAETMPERIRTILQTVESVGGQTGLPVFLIGGSVRDLFLKKSSTDLDLVVEGSAPDFAQALSGQLSGKLELFPRFRTAKLQVDELISIDLATARTEYYEYPAALPVVQVSSLRQDLYRRDFTINTLAISLQRKNFGQLFDLYDGLRDLKEKRIRVLHDLSFVEDPTRILRAIRFEQRLDFYIDSHTEDLIRAAVDLEMFSRLHTFRLGDELRLLLSEPHPQKVIRRMRQLHELHFIHPDIRYGQRMEQLLNAVDDALGWYSYAFLTHPLERWIVYLLVLLDEVTKPHANMLFKHFGFRKKYRDILRSAREVVPDILTALNSAGTPLRPEMKRLLAAAPPEVLLFCMAKAPQRSHKEIIVQFLTKYATIT